MTKENGHAKASHNGPSLSKDDLLENVKHDGLKEALCKIYDRDPQQAEFLNAVREVALSLQSVLDDRPDLLPVFEQLCEPDRQLMFRVSWLDDDNNLRTNRGYRVQFSSAIGPYKGGLRFHPSVNLSIIKMLGYEQIFKNALTTLPLGAGKGGSDFDPKGASDGEIQRFCQAFMTELARHIGDDVDVPAGDIGVGIKEVGYLYGQYKRLTGHFSGALTGKGMPFGGSWCRPEATGYGVVFMAEAALADMDVDLKGARCAVSGSGNVALHCATKLVQQGAVVLCLSDSKGTVLEPEGFTEEQLEEIEKIKGSHKGSLEDYKSSSANYFGDGAKPWQLDELGDITLAFPCATQNELDEDDAEALHSRGCRAVIEGANMPTTAAAVERLESHDMLYIPGKMANAGGVAVSGLEMAQNRAMDTWEAHDVHEKLRGIMQDVYRQAKENEEKYNCGLGAGANIAAFLKVAEALQAQGAV